MEPEVDGNGRQYEELGFEGKFSVTWLLLPNNMLTELQDDDHKIKKRLLHETFHMAHPPCFI